MQTLEAAEEVVDLTLCDAPGRLGLRIDQATHVRIPGRVGARVHAESAPIGSRCRQRFFKQSLREPPGFRLGKKLHILPSDQTNVRERSVADGKTSVVRAGPALS